MSVTITWKTHLACFLLALALSYCFGDVLYVSLFEIHSRYVLLNFTHNLFFDSAILVVAMMIPIVIIHEALHGICYILFKGKVRFGFKGIYAYCQETSNIKLQRTKFLMVLLAPVTIISLASLMLFIHWGALLFMLNLVGSTGDILMAVSLTKLNWNSYILDKKNGFDIIQMQ